MEKEKMFDILVEHTGVKATDREVILADSREDAINKFIEKYRYIPGTYECLGGREVITKHSPYVYSYDYLSDNGMDDYGWYSIIHCAPLGEDPFSYDQDYEKDGIYLNFKQTHISIYYSGVNTVSKAMDLIGKWVDFCLNAFDQENADCDALRYRIVRQVEKDGGCLDAGQDDAIMAYMPENEMFIDQPEPDTRCGVVQLPVRDDGDHDTYADRTRVHRNEASIDESTGVWSIATLFADSGSTEFAAGGKDVGWNVEAEKLKRIAQRVPCRAEAR